jgi:hypothetical protein
MARKKLHEMVADRYESQEVRDHVLQSAIDNKTVERIERGELVLPSEQDAITSLDIKLGRVQMSPTERDQEIRIKALEEQLESLYKSGKLDITERK